jgi:hypothetical protein
MSIREDDGQDATREQLLELAARFPDDATVA